MRGFHRFFGVTFSIILAGCVWGASAEQHEKVRLSDNLWFYWDLRLDQDADDLAQARATLERAKAAGYRGVMLGSGSRVSILPLLDETKRARARSFRKMCDELGLEISVAVWSFGYARESFFHYDQSLAAANPVFETRYSVTNGVAHPLPGERRELLTAGGTVHSPRRDGDVPKIAVKLKRNKSYRIHIRGEAEGVDEETSWPVVLAVRHVDGKTDYIEHRVFKFSEGKVSEHWLQFASMNQDEVTVLCRGYNRSFRGGVKIHSLVLEETPPYNVVRRKGTEIRVRRADGMRTFVEGKDFAEIPNAKNLWPLKNTKPLTLQILPDGAIREGDELLVDCYASFPTHGKWISACMAGPEVFEIMDRSAAAIAHDLNPKLWFLSFDEVRIGGGCANCQKIGDMAHVYARCVTNAMATIRTYRPDADIYIWNDMVDPECQKDGGWSQGLYSPITGVWNLLPKDLGIACWTTNRESALRFATACGHKTFIAGYYGRKTMKADREWVRHAKTLPGCDCRGMMYTQWGQGFAKLEEFAEAVRDEEKKAE